MFASSPLCGYHLWSIAISALLLTGCKPADTEDSINGYIEAEYVYISPGEGGILDALYTAKGCIVSAGDALFAVDHEGLEMQLKRAESAYSEAKSRLADLSKGKRPQELNVLEEQKAQAKVTLSNAQREFDRVKALVSAHAVSQADYDAKRYALELALARTAELDAQIETAKLPAREDELEAARHALEAARLAVQQADKRLKDNCPVTSMSGKVEDIYYRPGEFVPAGRPVVCLLPPENVKARFFVPVAKLPLLSLGKTIWVSCSGTAEKLPAHITYISSSAEYTPPVIFSTESREKLIFMVEAEFEDNTTHRLPPGLPISISLPHE